MKPRMNGNFSDCQKVNWAQNFIHPYTYSWGPEGLWVFASVVWSLKDARVIVFFPYTVLSLDKQR